MENFIAYNPTQVHFGKNVANTMPNFLRQYGKKVLLVYGKGSVMKNGSYHDTKKQLEKIKAEVIEFDGIKSNPRASDVDKAAAIGIENKVDMIIAIGGGSVIDSAKILSVCIKRKVKAWDVMKGKVLLPSSLPLIAILTLAATGSEMNNVAVLQNEETQEKIGYSNPAIFPKHSFLDPGYTQTVPASYTAYGIIDLIAHAMEAFFGKGESSLSDKFVYAIIREAIEFGPKLMNDLNNYDLRARIMWAATNALNGLTVHGRISGDWGVHAIGHVLSLLYDTPHGASLSIAYPAWLKEMKKRIPERITELGKNIFNTTNADETISSLEKLFKSLGGPVYLQEVNIEKDSYDEILMLLNQSNASGVAQHLKDEDRMEILTKMFK